MLSTSSWLGDSDVDIVVLRASTVGVNDNEPLGGNGACKFVFVECVFAPPTPNEALPILPLLVFMPEVMPLSQLLFNVEAANFPCSLRRCPDEPRKDKR